MGLLITTDQKSVMVFRQDVEYSGGTFAKYSIGVSSKSKDGDEWIKGYIPCKFKKGVEMENQTKIQINNAFYVVDKGKERNYVSLMITDFDIEGMTSKDEFLDVPDGIDMELPFK